MTVPRPLFENGKQPYVWAKHMVNWRMEDVSYEVWRQTKDHLQTNPMWNVRNIILSKIRLEIERKSRKAG